MIDFRGWLVFKPTGPVLSDKKLPSPCHPGRRISSGKAKGKNALSRLTARPLWTGLSCILKERLEIIDRTVRPVGAVTFI